jgi:hypothetical protein
LALSKLHIYQFYYDILIPKYPTSELPYTDTDKFIISIPTKDFYQDIFQDRKFSSNFDFSDYPKDHVCYNIDNKKKCLVRCKMS